MSRSLEEQRQDNVAKKKEAAIRVDERKVLAEELTENERGTIESR